jgi:nicotinamide mononucleotide transporter
MVVFYHAELFTEVLLQVFFIFIAVQGFLLWHKREDDGGIHINIGTGRENLRDIGLCLVATIGVGELTRRYAGASLALPDAAITIFSMYATVLVKRKRIENWLYWIVIDSGAAVLYGIKELYLTAGLFILYVFLAIIGYRQWKSRMN